MGLEYARIVHALAEVDMKSSLGNLPAFWSRKVFPVGSVEGGIWMTDILSNTALVLQRSRTIADALQELLGGCGMSGAMAISSVASVSKLHAMNFTKDIGQIFSGGCSENSPGNSLCLSHHPLPVPPLVRSCDC